MPPIPPPRYPFQTPPDPQTPPPSHMQTSPHPPFFPPPQFSDLTHGPKEKRSPMGEHCAPPRQDPPFPSHDHLPLSSPPPL